MQISPGFGQPPIISHHLGFAYQCESKKDGMPYTYGSTIAKTAGFEPE